MNASRALEVLDRYGVEYRLFKHDAGADHGGYARSAAEKLEVAPERVFKTLMVDAGKPVVALVPGAAMLNMKKLGKAIGVRRPQMMDAKRAENLTGYVTGGISPLGQKNSYPTVIDRSALDFDTIHVSAGHRGWNVEVSAADLIELTGARVADIADLGKHT